MISGANPPSDRAAGCNKAPAVKPTVHAIVSDALLSEERYSGTYTVCMSVCMHVHMYFRVISQKDLSYVQDTTHGRRYKVESIKSYLKR